MFVCLLACLFLFFSRPFLLIPLTPDGLVTVIGKQGAQKYRILPRSQTPKAELISSLLLEPEDYLAEPGCFELDPYTGANAGAAVMNSTRINIPEYQSS